MNSPEKEKREQETYESFFAVSDQQESSLHLQQKQEWSEEDEKMLKLLIAVLEVNHPNGSFKANEINTTNMCAISTKELVDWLKSLRPTWKPSDEQISAIVEALKYLPNNKEEWAVLDDLIDVLKKLKED